jgi:hypothetical protein
MTILETPRAGAELDLSVPGPNGRALLASQEANESSARTYPRRLPVAIAEASGSYVTDVDGRVYIDFLAGAGVLALGHNHPALVAAVQDQLTRLTHTGSWSALSAPRRSPLTGHPAFQPCTPCPTVHISIQIFTEFTSGASLRNAVQPRLTCNHGLICDRDSNGLLDLLPEVSRSPEERLSATASAQCPTAWGA